MAKDTSENSESNETGGSSSTQNQANPDHTTVAEFLGLSAETAEDVGQMYAVHPLPTCPHLVEVSPLPETGIKVSDPCGDCQNLGENWICLTCYTVKCSRFVNMHGVAHAAESGHSMALSFADLSVWCYKCDSYVHNPVIMPAKESAHLSKFGTPMPTA